ncbi:MAG: patatin-like phospholipase family protein [Bacteroidales bacterium]
MKKILSIDGGGIRGILSATIIANIEKRLRQEAKNPNLQIADCFDLLAGTSAGGILVALYLTPDKEVDGKRPKYSAQEALDFYTELGPILFKKSFGYFLRSVSGLIRSRYSEDALYSFSKKIIGDSYISEVMKDCLITAYDLSSRKAVLFSKFATQKYGDMADYKLCDIACSTSAAPSYFIPSQIFAKDNGARHLVDGGVYSANPSMCSLVEAIKIWPQEQISNFYMLSIGSGKALKPYHYNKTKNFGYLHWLNPILDILMASVAETVDYQVEQIFTISGVPQNYIRIEPPMLTADLKIDNASAKNIKKLICAAQHYIDHNDTLLDSICKSVINN